ncbi:MAG: hypothetical protein ACAH11_08985 [Sphingomonas sp.]
MLAYLLIPFGVFLACGIALLVERGRILRMLDKSDPDTFDRLGGTFMDGRNLVSVTAERGTPLAGRIIVYRCLWALQLCAGLAIPATFLFIVPR